MTRRVIDELNLLTQVSRGHLWMLLYKFQRRFSERICEILNEHVYGVLTRGPGFSNRITLEENSRCQYTLLKIKQGMFRVVGKLRFQAVLSLHKELRL